MITFLVNGKEEHLEGPIDIFTYIESLETKTTHFAVAYNGTVLPNDKLPETILANGDALEIVHAVGGG